MGLMLRAVLFAFIPAAAALAAGGITALWPPRPAWRSVLQHLAAGVVFAALGTEVLPSIMGRSGTEALILGFALGVGGMLAIRAWSHRLEQDTGRSLAVVVGADILIDGLLMGAGFAAGEREGGLLTIALAAEFLSLGSATSAGLLAARVGRGPAVLTVGGLGLLAVAGAAAGAAVLSHLGGAPMQTVLGFSAAALLYLVTEELLVEAHEVPETPLITATFFVGFLLMLVVARLAAPT